MAKKMIKIIGYLVLAAVVIGAIIIVVPKLSQKTPATSTGLTSTAQTNPQLAANQNLIAVLQSVNTITLPTSILQDPAFQSLSDISLSIARTNTQGRVNPFADLKLFAAPSTTDGNTLISTTPATTQ